MALPLLTKIPFALILFVMPDYTIDQFEGRGTGYYRVWFEDGRGPGEPVGPFATIAKLCSNLRISESPRDGYVVWFDGENVHPSNQIATINPDDLWKTPIFRKWKKRIESGTVSRTLCRQFALSASRMARGFEPAGAKTNLSEIEAVELDRLIFENPVRLPAEDAAKGIDWLRKYAKTLLHRDQGFASEFPVDRVDEIDHFLFYGVSVPSTDYLSVPVWTAVLHNGDKIDYCAVPWQQYAWSGTPRSEQFVGWWTYSSKTIADLRLDDPEPIAPTTSYGCGADNCIECYGNEAWRLANLPDYWLSKQFEHEGCELCGGFEDDHTVERDALGNFRAVCNDDDSETES